MASGLILGSNLVSQRKRERDSFLASKKLQECVVLWLAFFSLPLHQHNFKSTMPNNILFSWTIDVGCGKTIFQIRAYPRWRCFSFILLYYDVLLTELNPCTDAPCLFSSSCFGWWNFFTKGWITWSRVWSLFSLCGLPLHQLLTLWGLPLLEVPLLSGREVLRVWTFLQWVWNWQACSLLLQQ